MTIKVLAQHTWYACSAKLNKSKCGNDTQHSKWRHFSILYSNHYYYCYYWVEIRWMKVRNWRCAQWNWHLMIVVWAKASSNGQLRLANNWYVFILMAEDEHNAITPQTRSFPHLLKLSTSIWAIYEKNSSPHSVLGRTNLRDSIAIALRQMCQSHRYSVHNLCVHRNLLQWFFEKS